MSFMRSTTLCLASVATVSIAMFDSAPAQAGQCRDPWVTQAVTQVAGREPNGQGEFGECAITNYGGGHWSDYNDLLGKVRARFPAPITSAPQSRIVPPSSLMPQNNGAGILTRDGAGVISRDGAGVISRDGAGIVSRDGAGIRQ